MCTCLWFTLPSRVNSGANSTLPPSARIDLAVVVLGAVSRIDSGGTLLSLPVLRGKRADPATARERAGVGACLPEMQKKTPTPTLPRSTGRGEPGYLYERAGPGLHRLPEA